MNLYSYVINNPVNYVDPYGENTLIWGIIGLALVAELVVVGYQTTKTCPPMKIPLWDYVEKLVPIFGLIAGLPMLSKTYPPGKGPTPKNKPPKVKNPPPPRQVPPSKNPPPDVTKPSPHNKWWKDWWDKWGDLFGGVEGLGR